MSGMAGKSEPMVCSSVLNFTFIGATSRRSGAKQKKIPPLNKINVMLKALHRNSMKQMKIIR